MAHLALALLGPLQITLDARPVSGFDYDKVRALLAYLAVEADRAHRRDALAGLLWPDQPDQAAHNSLRQALATLRRAIGEQAAAVPVLQITREAVQFNQASDHDLDMAAFTTLLAACERHPHRHPATCLSCARRLQQAVALYRGDFLAQFYLPDSIPFEEWALLKREELHRQSLQALIQLADYHERRGEYTHTQRYAGRQLELDPWREEAHRQLMRVLVVSGQRSAALAQYERCRRVLAEELRVEPEAETTALYARIRDAEADTFTTSELLTHLPLHLNNLPASTTRFVGREHELAKLAELIADPACRLLTLVGLGGVGKTRLAVQAATKQIGVFTQGVYFVSLAPLSSAAFLVPAIAEALAFTFGGAEDPKAQLLNYLREKELLLLLDNLEHLLDGVGLLTEILRHAPGVSILATSRERLSLQGEWVVEVAGLHIPEVDQVADIEEYSATALFLQNARRVQADFALSATETPAVICICRLVAGMPLGIELAASWLRVLSCGEIAREIAHSIEFLTTALRDVPARHRSLRAVFDQSWNLLTDAERRVFRKLSVFRGGFGREAAEHVAGATLPLLSGLVDKSLLQRHGEARYDLHELVRQYADEKLCEAGEADTICRAHTLYFLELAEMVEPKLTSSARGEWLEQLDREHDNLRAAMVWSQSSAGAGEIGLRLVGALFWFWYYRNYVSEGWAWAEGMLATATGSGQPRTWANALYSAGFLAYMQGNLAAARARLTESVEHWRETGDRRGLALALGQLGVVLSDYGEHIVAHNLCAESVAITRELGNLRNLARALFLFGYVAQMRGDDAASHPIYEESLALWRVVADPWGLALPLFRLGIIVCKQGDYATARVLLEESLGLQRQVGCRWLMSYSLFSLAEVALCQGDYLGATARLAESLALHQDSGASNSIAETLDQFARVAAGQRQLERAARLWAAAHALRDVIGVQIPPNGRLDYEHAVAAARAELDEEAFAAAWAAGQALTLEQAIAYALEEHGGLARVIG
jgi:predicted ATPase/DNA-binding SARP family transcriptional activator